LNFPRRPCSDHPKRSPSSDAISAPGATSGAPVSPAPRKRVWRRFTRNRLGYWSLVIFVVLYGISLCAALLSNDKPLLVRYHAQLYFPIVKTYPETTFGGQFPTPTDYLDPYIRDRFREPGNFAIYPLNHYSYDTLNYFAQAPNPAPPSRENWLGTDDSGRDVFARLLYGFALSVSFGLALTAIGTLVGMLAGALQGYFGGRVDLAAQRFIEVWGSLPELYLLIIFASIFEPSVSLLLVLLSLFGWMGLANYVRAEFLRNRTQDYVKAARAMGLSNRQIIWRHILPNSMTPVITFLPFRMSEAILALTSLDFLGLGVPPPTPSLGELLAQGKANLDAWWISMSTFGVLVATLMLLTFMGDALRDALDARMSDALGVAAGQSPAQAR
jgi:microcin C transport system permease protein